MSDEGEYKRLDFINNLIKPWDELHSFLLQPYSLDPKFSDPVISARSLAISASHQWDADKDERSTGINDDDLAAENPAAMRIKDLCNTIKHIHRNRGNHAEINGISAQVLLTDDKKFRFIRNQITYHHESDGEFDLIDDIQKAIYFWAERRDINIAMLVNWHGGQISVSPCPPSEAITLFHDPDVCIHQRSQGLKLFKLGGSGELVPTDHDNIAIQVIGVNNLAPFATIKLNIRDTLGVYNQQS
jgi:hypothetical protein